MMCVAVFYTAYMRMPVIIYAHACHYICARLSLKVSNASMAFFFIRRCL